LSADTVASPAVSDAAFLEQVLLLHMDGAM
jgi:hypothetical protein